MPRVIDPSDIDHAAELYASGKSLKETASEVGISPETIAKYLRGRGVEIRPRAHRAAGWNRLPTPPGVIDRYVGGESELSIATDLGVSRRVVERWLKEAGVPRRGRGASALVAASQLTPEERRARAAAAHDAVRGVPMSDLHAAKVALGKERSGYGGRTSPGSDRLETMLREAGIEYLREKAITRYNVDFALSADSIAVEVLGGDWHGSKPIHAVRTPRILNEGWNILFVWDTPKFRLGSGAMRYLVAWIEEMRVNPPSVCEYRVIRGDGEFAASGKADDDDFPLVKPSERGFKPRASHYRPRKKAVIV